MIRFDGNVFDQSRQSLEIPIRFQKVSVTNAGNNRVANYIREDYASLQRITESGNSDILEGRNLAYSSNNTVPNSRTQNAGYRALYSLQLCNNENTVKALMQDTFSIGYNPESGDVVIDTHGDESAAVEISENNLVYKYDSDRDLFPDGWKGSVLDIPATGDPFKPRVGPSMGQVGDAIFLSPENTEYISIEWTQIEKKTSSNDFTQNA